MRGMKSKATAQQQQQSSTQSSSRDRTAGDMRSSPAAAAASVPVPRSSSPAATATPAGDASSAAADLSSAAAAADLSSAAAAAGSSAAAAAAAAEPSAAAALLQTGLVLPGASRSAFEIAQCPREVSCLSDEAFRAHSAYLLLSMIQRKLEESPYTKVVVGLSGGSTPGPIYARLRQLVHAADAQQQEFQDNATAKQANKLSFPASPSAASSSSPYTSSFITTASPSRRGVRGDTDWSRVFFFLVDERFIHPLHENSNQRMIREQLLGQSLHQQELLLQQKQQQQRTEQQQQQKTEQQQQQKTEQQQGTEEQQQKSQTLEVPEENLIFPDTTLPLDECLAKYRNDMLQLLSATQHVDVVTLGLGEDSHIASIFPPLSQQQLQQQLSPNSVVLHTQSERFACRDRITVSLQLICAAQHKFFFIMGTEKVKLWRKMLSAENLLEIWKYPALGVVQSGSVRVVATPPLDEAVEKSKLTAAADKSCLSFLIFGASGDLARHKTYPALFCLFCEGFLPRRFHIMGYARTPMPFDVFWEKVLPGMESLSTFFGSRAGAGLHARGLLEEFKMHCSYTHGQYDDVERFAQLNRDLLRFEEGSESAGRVLYLALPPQIFLTAIRSYKQACWNKTGWNRVVVEKPFGRDSATSEDLSQHLTQLLQEKEIYRMDHYLGKEMALSLISLRFANMAFMPLFHRNYVRSVRITFKEEAGTWGRGGYFDEYGIIRDVMQNHMIQLLVLTAMDRPASLSDDDVRDEKVKVLKQIPPIKLSETVLGQFVASADGKQRGYTDDATVPKDSRTATFCTSVLWINSERWFDVPFIFKAGKALESKKTEVRLQLREAPAASTFFRDANITSNELVIQVQPREAVYLKMYTKKPGLCSGLQPTELDLSVVDRFDVERLPDAYERLILDVIKGNKQNFVRTDELREAWRIFTPLLHEIEEKKITPLPYAAGSTGPKASYDLIQRFYSYKKNDYRWSPPTTCRR